MSEAKTNKGISLRRKKGPRSTRPTISAPRQIQTRTPSGDSRNLSIRPTNDSSSSLGGSRERPKLTGDQTSDLVKRRYSTRFAGGVPQDGPPPPMPAMPSLPPQFAAANGGPSLQRPSAAGDRAKSSDRERGRGKVKVDLRALRDPNLSVEKYVQSILADASEGDIHSYQKDLQSAKSHTDADLKHNVYQNRTQFIKISKEADRLKSEMRTLRTLMNELTGALGHATNAGGADLDATSALSVADRKRANRSSVANLEAMWSTHLQTLWKRVEGSQKYLPALPGRHIILESQRWVELNAATWKPRRRVALVLLNDHLLVASEKKRNDIAAGPNAVPSGKGNRMSMYNPASSQAPTTTFVAERCWPLHDVSLADISTHSSSSVGHNNTRENKIISNSINIRAGSESFTYAIPDTAEKAGLIVAFRKAQEDLRKQVAAEHGEREKAFGDLAILTGRDPRLLKRVTAAANESAADSNPANGHLNRSNSILVDHEGRQQSVRWVEAQIDGLDIDIALQRFEEAVVQVEKLRKTARGIKGNLAAQEIITAKVNERASRLAHSIARQLKQNSGAMERTKESVNWLLRLGFEELARTTYLASRTETIRIRTRQLPFTGALEPHMQSLSYVTFTLLLHTFTTFNQAFPHSSSSSVVRWAKERVDEFNAMLERQLSSIDRGSPVWDECIDAVKTQSDVLAEVGIDFRGLVARNLESNRPDIPPST